MTAIPRRADEELDYRPSYRAAAIASAVIFLLYLVTLSPSTAMWDTSEYIAAAFRPGHRLRRGNPFFVILGRFFAILPIAPNAAAASALANSADNSTLRWMWFLITERVLV